MSISPAEMPALKTPLNSGANHLLKPIKKTTAAMHETICPTNEFPAHALAKLQIINAIRHPNIMARKGAFSHNMCFFALTSLFILKFLLIFQSEFNIGTKHSLARYVQRIRQVTLFIYIVSAVYIPSINLRIGSK